MSDEKNEQEESYEFQYKKSILIRHLVEMGERWEGLRHSAAWTLDREVFLYNMFIRWPRKPSEDHLIIAKGVSEEGAKIAFHGGMGLTAALATYGQRYLAGKLQWRDDLEPPSSLEGYEDHIRREMDHVRATRPKR